MPKTPRIYDVYTDASVSTNRNTSGIGWVIFRQPNGGRYIQAGAKRFRGKNTRNTKLCEIYAALEALNKITASSEINLYCDDTDLIKLINGPKEDILARAEKSANTPLLGKAYTDLADALEEHRRVTAIKSEPSLSPYFEDAHQLAQMGEQLTRKTMKKSRAMLRAQSGDKKIHISLEI